MGYTKSIETKRRLLRSTAKLLRTRGYSATGLSEILKTSGVPRGSLYHHFPAGKQQVAAIAIEQSGESIVSELNALFDGAGSVAKGIGRFCDYYINELESCDFARGCPLATVALETSATANEVQDRTGAAFEGIASLVADKLHDEGHEDADNLAVVVVSMVEGALVLAKSTRNTRHIAIVRDWAQSQLAVDERSARATS